MFLFFEHIYLIKNPSFIISHLYIDDEVSEAFFDFRGDVSPFRDHHPVRNIGVSGAAAAGARKRCHPVALFRHHMHSEFQDTQNISQDPETAANHLHRHHPLRRGDIAPQGQIAIRYLRRDKVRTPLSLHLPFRDFHRTDIYGEENRQISEIPKISSDYNTHGLISPTRIKIPPAESLLHYRIWTVQ